MAKRKPKSTSENSSPSAYVLDTSALLFDPDALTHFKSSHIYIPVSVLQELDRHKDRLDEVGRNAREINRKLYDLKQKGSLRDGVSCEDSEVTVFVFAETLEDVPFQLDSKVADDRILSASITLTKGGKYSGEVYLVTNDLNLGLKAEAYGIKSFAFQPLDKYRDTEYRGVREILEYEDLESIDIGSLYKAPFKVKCPDSLSLNENEYLILKNPHNKQSARAVYRSGYIHLLNKDFDCYGIKPLNVEQYFAIEALLNPEIKLVTLTGRAGSGKTLISVATGLMQCLDSKEKLYERIVVSRSLVLLSGKDKLGFLKGGIKEKLDPYLLPLKDAVDQVVGTDALAFDYLTATTVGPVENTKPSKPKIEIEPLQYIRGRNLNNVFFIVDEVQNLTLMEVKTIVSRIGEGAKIILLGDIDQIDNPYLSKYTNGMSQVVERFKDSKIAAHISLKDGVRSQLASEAAERL